MEGGNMGKRLRRGKRQKKFLADERFATKVIVAIGITTAIFIAAQYVSFLITGIEQTTLITYYFTAVVIECGALMLKTCIGNHCCKSEEKRRNRTGNGNRRKRGFIND